MIWVPIPFYYWDTGTYYKWLSRHQLNTPQTMLITVMVLVIDYQLSSIGTRLVL